MVVSFVVSMIVFLKDEFNLKILKKINKYTFPSIFLLSLVILLLTYSYDEDINTLVKSDVGDTNLVDDYNDTEYNDTEYDSTEYENTDFTTSQPEEVTLYSGVHIGGADIVAGSYLASTTSSEVGNLFVYDDSHILAYSEFYGSSDSTNREGTPVYIEDGGEIKISGISSVTFTPISN
ncbi:hypothetical protein [Mammaliicoccus lentus]|uniref:hypothetical protein n=2 Tax=Mammaliicoccus lentus TaxID=42858 RepID=UPI0018844005|nr:hypothetical protein [Mammaliicoccus lentus]